MLFTYEDVSDKFGDVVRSWFRFSRDYRCVCNRYFSLFYGQWSYVEPKFETICQAIRDTMENDRDHVTPDLGGKGSTQSFGEAIAKRVKA